MLHEMGHTSSYFFVASNMLPRRKCPLSQELLICMHWSASARAFCILLSFSRAADLLLHNVHRGLNVSLSHVDRKEVIETSDLKSLQHRLPSLNSVSKRGTNLSNMAFCGSSFRPLV